MSVQAAVDAFKEVKAHSEIAPIDAFRFIDTYKAQTGHRPSLSAMTLLYLREKAQREALESR